MTRAPAQGRDLTVILAAMLVVAVSGVLLVLGVVRGDDLVFVYAAIGGCLLAAVLLAVGVARSRPSRRGSHARRGRSGRTPHP